VQKAVVVVSCCSHTPWQAGEEGARSKFVDVGLLLICELDGSFRSAEVGMHDPVGGNRKASTSLRLPSARRCRCCKRFSSGRKLRPILCRSFTTLAARTCCGVLQEAVCNGGLGVAGFVPKESLTVATNVDRGVFSPPFRETMQNCWRQ